MLDPTQDHTRLAKLVRLERVGSSFKLEIDGERFPYAIAGDDTITISMERESLATVRFSLMAERLELVDDLLGERSDD